MVMRYIQTALEAVRVDVSVATIKISNFRGSAFRTVTGLQMKVKRIVGMALCSQSVVPLVTIHATARMILLSK